MADLNAVFQSADWKSEKHVPVIEIVGEPSKEAVNVKVSIGKEVPHPNTTAHHIRWVQLLFHPEGAKFPIEIGKADWSAHGAGAGGVDTSGVYCAPVAWFTLKSDKPGTLMAFSYCNIHGLWQNEMALNL